jgi:hypothetical protein
MHLIVQILIQIFIGRLGKWASLSKRRAESV